MENRCIIAPFYREKVTLTTVTPLIKPVKKRRLLYYLFVHSVDHIMSVRRNYATI